MANASKAKGRKGKIGKNKARIAAYYNSGRYELNKLRRLNRHLAVHGFTDLCAVRAARVHKAAAPLHISRQFKFI